MSVTILRDASSFQRRACGKSHGTVLVDAEQPARPRLILFIVVYAYQFGFCLANAHNNVDACRQQGFNAVVYRGASLRLSS